MYAFKYTHICFFFLPENDLLVVFDKLARASLDIAKPYILKSLNSFAEYLKKPVNFEEMKQHGTDIECKNG